MIMRMINSIKNRLIHLYYDYLQYKLTMSYNRHMKITNRIHHVEEVYMGIHKHKVDWEAIEANFEAFEVTSHKPSEHVSDDIKDIVEQPIEIIIKNNE
jgi:hypothetical protein